MSVFSFHLHPIIMWRISVVLLCLWATQASSLVFSSDSSSPNTTVSPLNCIRNVPLYFLQDISASGLPPSATVSLVLLEMLDILDAQVPFSAFETLAVPNTSLEPKISYPLPHQLLLQTATLTRLDAWFPLLEALAYINSQPTTAADVRKIQVTLVLATANLTASLSVSVSSVTPVTTTTSRASTVQRMTRLACEYDFVLRSAFCSRTSCLVQVQSKCLSTLLLRSTHQAPLVHQIGTW